MMNVKIFILAFLMLLSGLKVAIGQGVRETKLFNSDWKFNLGDVSAAREKDFDDSHWRQLNLPHDWSIELNFDKKYASSTAYLPGGIGWYRKSFDVPASFQNKDVSICFDSVYNNSEVWINGKYLGKRPYGYITFAYDLTPYILIGQKNTIAVRVDHSKFVDTRWYSGSGIYRNVWLSVTSKLHVNQWGTYITTPQVNASEAKIQVVTKLSNKLNTVASAKVVLTVFDKDLKQVAEKESIIDIKESSAQVDQTLEVKNPKLWSVETPNLYTLKTSVWVNGILTDETTEPFGIRTITFDSNKGFLLNGKSVKIKGVCLHHEAGCVGAAVPIKLWKIRLSKLKAAGCNAIRTSHNPVAPEFLDLCDQMGFLVMDEAFDEWEYAKRKWVDGWNNSVFGTDGYSQYFGEWAERDLRDMVERDKNHPSIIMWSIGNEVDYANDPYADPQTPDFTVFMPDAHRMAEIAVRLKSVVKSVDVTRPVTMALANARNSIRVGLPDVLDISGYNYTESRYESDHKAFPDRFIYGSENSQSYSAWLAVKKNDFISAQFLWTGVDYLGEAGRFPSRSSYAGLLDLTGNEKPIYYWRQSMWSEKPMIKLVARKKHEKDNIQVDPMDRGWFINEVDKCQLWNYQPGDSVLVVAFSNCQEVELFVNNKSFGKKTYNEQNSCFWWYIPYETGVVKAVAKNKGEKPVVSVLNTVYNPVKLKVTSDSNIIKADGSDVAVVEVSLVDKNGNASYLSKNNITFEVSGEGNIIGTDNGDANCIDNFKQTNRNAYGGRCIAVVQSTGKPGKITVVVKSDGLPDSFIEIEAK
jgi:hypothetical protein